MVDGLIRYGCSGEGVLGFCGMVGGSISGFLGRIDFSFVEVFSVAQRIAPEISTHALEAEDTSPSCPETVRQYRAIPSLLGHKLSKSLFTTDFSSLPPRARVVYQCWSDFPSIPQNLSRLSQKMARSPNNNLNSGSAENSTSPLHCCPAYLTTL